MDPGAHCSADESADLNFAERRKVGKSNWNISMVENILKIQLFRENLGDE